MTFLSSTWCGLSLIARKGNEKIPERQKKNALVDRERFFGEKRSVRNEREGSIGKEKIRDATRAA